MNLNQIINRQLPPKPWAEGENIPWNDPDFSERMLKEHLSQVHDLASRRFETIDQQVQWIHKTVLEEKPGKILDLACGPGFYTSRFAQLGHVCFGIDFAPAAIAYAEETAKVNEEPCTYTLGDLRQTDFGRDYHLVMMIFGQFNVFRRDDAFSILKKAHDALLPEGYLLLEPQKYETVKGRATIDPSWFTRGEAGGLWSETPHLCLNENFWDDTTRSKTERFFIINAKTGEVTSHSMTTEAYADNQFKDILLKTGFENICFFPSLVGVEVEDESQAVNFAVVAQKPCS